MNPFNRKKFIASAEAYLEGCRQEAEAKIYLANLATRDIKNLAAKLERLEDSNPPALKGPDPEPPHSDSPYTP